MIARFATLSHCVSLPAQLGVRAGAKSGYTSGDARLFQVEEVLQARGLAQVDAVRDVLAQQHRGHQVVDVACLACGTSV